MFSDMLEEMSKNFICRMCGDSRNHLYSVMLSLWDEREDPLENMPDKFFEEENTIAYEAYIKVYNSRYGFTRSFICPQCFQNFIRLERMIVKINNRFWRLSADNFFPMLNKNEHPAIYTVKKWKQYQKKHLNNMMKPKNEKSTPKAKMVKESEGFIVLEGEKVYYIEEGCRVLIKGKFNSNDEFEFYADSNSKKKEVLPRQMLVELTKKYNKYMQKKGFKNEY